MNTQTPVSTQRMAQMGLVNEPLGYVDGMNTYQALRDNPINRVDPQGLASILIHEADAGRASGHAGLVIDNPVAAGLPGTYPSGRAVLSWQGSKQGTIQAQFGDLYVYDFDDYLKASWGKIFEWRIPCNATKEGSLFTQAKTRPTWKADMKNNCACRVRETLSDVLAEAKRVQQIDGLAVPSEMQSVLGKPDATHVGTGTAPGSSSGSSGSGSSSS